VLHRLLAGRNRARDDEDAMAAPLLLGRELGHVQRRATEVEAGDGVDD
jgi:hypothetical protein